MSTKKNRPSKRQQRLLTAGDHRAILVNVGHLEGISMADEVNTLIGSDLADYDALFKNWICDRILQFAPINAMFAWVLVDAVWTPEDGIEQRIENTNVKSSSNKRQAATR